MDNMKYLFLLVVIIILSCSSESNDQKDKVNSIGLKTLKDTLRKPTFLDTVRQTIIAGNKNYIDTANYKFALEGNFSAEGNDGEAIYADGKIKKINITFYGEMGKATSSYTFSTENIKVEQKTYNYDSTLSGKIISSKTISYDINYEGKFILSDIVGADIDIFLELKKSIPFTLK